MLAKLREETGEIEAEIERIRATETGSRTRSATSFSPSPTLHATLNRPRPGAPPHQRQVHAPLRLDRGRAGAGGRTPADASLDEMEALWQAAKSE